MSFVGGLVLGGVVGVLLERLLGSPLDRFVIDPLRERRQLRRLQAVVGSYAVEGELVRVAGQHLFVRQLHPAGFTRAELLGPLDRELTLADRFSMSGVGALIGPLDGLLDDIARRRGELELSEQQWNGTHVCPTSIDISRRPDTEEPVLSVRFAVADHATMQVVSARWQEAHGGDPARLMDGDALRTVDPLLANGFGINATVETADGKLLVARRGAGTSSWHGRWHTSMNEGAGINDVVPGGKVDLMHTLLRGLREELGLEPAEIPQIERRIVVHTLALDVVRYEWALLAHVDLRGTPWTSAEISAARALGAAHDDWEASDVRFLPFVDAEAVGAGGRWAGAAREDRVAPRRS